jgi:hypothetical protein
MDTVFLMRIGNRQAACRAQASTSWWCTPNTGKGSPAARILSLFGL